MLFVSCMWYIAEINVSPKLAKLTPFYSNLRRHSKAHSKINNIFALFVIISLLKMVIFHTWNRYIIKIRPYHVHSVLRIFLSGVIKTGMYEEFMKRYKMYSVQCAIMLRMIKQLWIDALRPFVTKLENINVLNVNTEHPLNAHWKDTWKQNISK